MTPDPAETLKLLPESTPVLRFVYISGSDALPSLFTVKVCMHRIKYAFS